MKALVYKIADGHTVDDLTEEVCCGAWVISPGLCGTSPAMYLPCICAKQTVCMRSCLQYIYHKTCKASSRLNRPAATKLHNCIKKRLGKCFEAQVGYL